MLERPPCCAAFKGPLNQPTKNISAIHRGGAVNLMDYMNGSTRGHRRLQTQFD